MSADCGAALVAGAVDDVWPVREAPESAACAGADAGFVRARTDKSSHDPVRLRMNDSAGLKKIFTA